MLVDQGFAAWRKPSLRIFQKIQDGVSEGSAVLRFQDMDPGLDRLQGLDPQRSRYHRNAQCNASSTCS